jgi:riboflavin kinase
VIVHDNQVIGAYRSWLDRQVLVLQSLVDCFGNKQSKSFANTATTQAPPPSAMVQESSGPGTAAAATTTAAAAAAKGGSEQDPERIVRMLPIRIVSRVVRGFGRGSKDLGIPTANLATSNNSGDDDLDNGGGGGGGTTTRIALSAGRRDEIDGPAPTLEDLPTGIYWGFCRIGEIAAQQVLAASPSSLMREEDGNSSSSSSSSNPNINNHRALGRTLKCAVSIGYNPTYGNDVKTIEPHLIAPQDDPRRHASSCQETLFSDFYGHPCRLSVVGYLRPELPFEGLDKLTQAIKSDIAQAERLAGASDDDPTLVAERNWVDSNEVL